ncbi:MAG: polysaccharide export protein [Acidobacteriales bacterium]|nr:polysaccharide export protein [Terriglobales bacterium]
MGIRSHIPTFIVLGLAGCIVQLALVAAEAQQQQQTIAKATGQAATIHSGVADGNPSPALTGDRRPHYRLHISDVMNVSFAFAPEFDQTLIVQPDGFITLKDAPALYLKGETLSQAREDIAAAYEGVLYQPQVTLTLKDFERPFFIATGQIAHAGKFELREDITVTEALAIAGGFTEPAKHSQVVLFRRLDDQVVEAHLLNVKQMLKSRDLREDIYIKSGDLIFVPQSTISKIRRYIPSSSLGTILSPSQF